MTNVKCQIVYGGPAEPPEQLLIISDVGLCKSFACSHSDLQRDPEFLDYRISKEFPYALIFEDASTADGCSRRLMPLRTPGVGRATDECRTTSLFTSPRKTEMIPGFP